MQQEKHPSEHTDSENKGKEGVDDRLEHPERRRNLPLNPTPRNEEVQVHMTL